MTAFFQSPPETPPKPRISGFSTMQFDAIERLDPDLIITFSDVQAGFAAEFMRRGFPVLATNQRTLAEIEGTLALLARIVGGTPQAEKCLNEFRERMAPVTGVANCPRVYFEEWNDPLVSGIAWVSELIERAGGTDIFSELRTKRAASERSVTSEQVCRANPDIILASWCGKPVQITEIVARPGWRDLAAVREQRIHEIPSDDILQPGFRLVYGYERIKQALTSKESSNQSPSCWH